MISALIVAEQLERGGTMEEAEARLLHAPVKLSPAGCAKCARLQDLIDNLREKLSIANKQISDDAWRLDTTRWGA